MRLPVVCLLFEFYCARRFAGHVVEDSVDVADFVDDPAGDGLQYLVGTSAASAVM